MMEPVQWGDRSLPDSILRHICSGIPACLFGNLEDLVQTVDLCFDGELFGLSENISEEDYEREDYAFLKGKRFDGVFFYCEYYGDPIIMSYQEFYALLCCYVEIRIADESEAFQTTARTYLNALKEKYHLKNGKEGVYG